MKKVIALIAALSLNMVMAGSTSTVVTINATVDNSCVFDTPSSAASFTYTAGGSPAVTNVTNGTATLYCNKGTMASVVETTPASPIAVVLSKTGGDTLNATATVTSTAGTTPTTGTYTGADVRTYTVAPSAVANQWGASSGSYTGSITISVTF